MKPRYLFLVAASALLFTGCASTSRLTTANLVNAYGADAKAVNRVAVGSPLSVSDIAEMGRRGVPDRVILDTLRSRNDSYRLTTAQVGQLKEAGVTDRVIDYLLSSRDMRPVRPFWPSRLPSHGHHIRSRFGSYGRHHR